MKFCYGDLVRFESSELRNIPQLHNEIGIIRGLYSEVGLAGPQYIVNFIFRTRIKMPNGFETDTFVLDEDSLTTKLNVHFK